MTFSCDRGHTLVPVKAADPGKGVVAIVALDEPGALVALYDGELHRSSDAGCTWSPIDRKSKEGFQTWPKLIRGAGGRVYGFQWGTHDPFMIDRYRLEWIRRPGSDVHGLGADREDPARLRAADRFGQLRESRDSGKHWETVGQPPPHSAPHYGPLLSSLTFDPADLDHALFTSAHESFVTRNGGTSWMPVQAPEHPPSRVEFSPIDGNLVWAWNRTGLLRSKDGGERFELVAQASIRASPPPYWIKPDPANADAAFVFLADLSGSNLRRVDVGRGSDDSRSVAWTLFEASPATPELWYVGLMGTPLPVE